MSKPKTETLNNTRSIVLDRAKADLDTRTVSIAISSETPVERWNGMEILSHDRAAVDLSRLMDGGPVLVDHDPTDIVGVLESVSVDEDRVMRGTVRFGRSARAEEVWNDVVDGIRTKISVGYSYRSEDIQLQKPTGKGQPAEYRVTRWMPMEVSIVSIPADASVGVGRSVSSDLEDETIPAHHEAVIREVPMESTHPTSAPEVTTETRSANIAEALQIRAMAEKLGVGAEADRLLSAGGNLDDVRAQLMDTLSKKQPAIQAANVDMSHKEARQYSYARAIANAAAIADGSRVQRGLEEEVSDTIQKQLPNNYKYRGGIMVPLNTRAGLDSTSSTAGAELKYTEFGGELIDLLRNQAAVIRMGARVMSGLTSPISFPRQSAAGTAAWVAENPGSDASESNLTLGTVTLSPKMLTSTTSYSRALLVTSSVDVEAMVRADLAAIHALAFDLAAIHGTGSSNQPTGIYKTTSVNTKAMGGSVAYGELVDMITEVALDNALMGTTGFMTNPCMAGKLMQTAPFTYATGPIWTGTYDDGRIAGYKAIATNQVSKVMSTLEATGGSEYGIIFGNWSDLMLGLWGALELITDPLRLKKQAMIEVTSYQMADVQVRHPQSFCVATGATLA